MHEDLKLKFELRQDMFTVHPDFPYFLAPIPIIKILALALALALQRSIKYILSIKHHYRYIFVLVSRLDYGLRKMNCCPRARESQVSNE